MIDINHVRKKLNISNEWIAEKAGYSSTKSYTNSKNKPKVENMIVAIYSKIKETL